MGVTRLLFIGSRHLGNRLLAYPISNCFWLVISLLIILLTRILFYLSHSGLLCISHTL